jgi:DNA-binding NtrC family response regulator
VIKLEVPPLRDRREDIPLLSAHFLEKYRERYQSSVQQFPKDLMESLLRYDWPGNVRQLENIVKRYLILPDADVASELKVTGTEEVVPIHQGNVSLKEVAGHAAEVAEKEVVLRVLEETGWNRKESARRLRISYKALRNKLKKWQLVREKPGDAVRTLVKSA